MNIKSEAGNVFIEGVAHFNIERIFNSGQIFRFSLSEDGIYTAAVNNRILRLSQSESNVTIYNCTLEEFESRYRSFFALNEDYGSILKRIDTDEHMSRALEFGSGIRILKQDLWEMTISFIVSQNNNIPRIKKIIASLCDNYGSEIKLGTEIFHAFPTFEQLSKATEKDLKELGTGYRDSYILDAAKKVACGELDLVRVTQLDTVEARAELMKIKGVGGKVADCILLFGMSRYEACPHDVWVKRIFSEKYNVDKISEKTGYAFARERWGEYAGIAQQYLFYYERENYRQAAETPESRS